MVASSANTSRPRRPDSTGGLSVRARLMNASISGRGEIGAGSAPALDDGPSRSDRSLLLMDVCLGAAVGRTGLGPALVATHI
jgi:hypothetical protein